MSTLFEYVSIGFSRSFSHQHALIVVGPCGYRRRIAVNALRRSDEACDFPPVFQSWLFGWQFVRSCLHLFHRNDVDVNYVCWVHNWVGWMETKTVTPDFGVQKVIYVLAHRASKHRHTQDEDNPLLTRLSPVIFAWWWPLSTLVQVSRDDVWNLSHSKLVSANY